MRTFVALLAALLVSVSMISGCGNQAAEEGAPAETEETTTYSGETTEGIDEGKDAEADDSEESEHSESEPAGE